MPALVRWATPVALILAVAVVGGAVAAGAGRSTWWWAVAALAVAAYTSFVTGFVARRAVPGATTSARTGRYSIGAITGGGVALIVLCASAAVGVLGKDQHLSFGRTIASIGFGFALGAAALAWIIASATWIGGAAPRVKLGAAGLVVALLAASIGIGWWHEHSPYGPEAVHPTATIVLTDEAHLQADAAALGVDMQGVYGGLGQMFIGRLDFAVPAAAHGVGRYYLLAIDRRTNEALRQFGTRNGFGWDGFLFELPDRVPWLAGVSPWSHNRRAADGTLTSYGDASAVVVATDAGRTDFMGSVDPSPGFDPALLSLLLVFVGPDDQIYWATPVPTS